MVYRTVVQVVKKQRLKNRIKQTGNRLGIKKANGNDTQQRIKSNAVTAGL